MKLDIFHVLCPVRHSKYIKKLRYKTRDYKSPEKYIENELFDNGWMVILLFDKKKHRQPF